MVREMENSFWYLFNWGVSNDVDMMQVINTPAKNGRTLFDFVASFSSGLSRALIEIGVKVHTINDQFKIPLFAVSITIIITIIVTSNNFTFSVSQFDKK